MADEKLSALPVITTLADTDKLYISDAAGPASKATTVLTVKTNIKDDIKNTIIYSPVADAAALAAIPTGNLVAGCQVHQIDIITNFVWTGSAWVVSYPSLVKTDLFGVGGSLHANIQTADMGGGAPSTSKIYYMVHPSGIVEIAGAFSVSTDIVASRATGIILLNGASLLNGAATLDAAMSLTGTDGGGDDTVFPAHFDRVSNQIEIGNGVTLATGTEFMVHARIFAY